MKKKLIFAFTAILMSVIVFAQEAKTVIQAHAENESEAQKLIQKLYAETDGKKAELISAEIVKNIDTNPLWKGEAAKRDMYRVHPLYAYLNAEDFKGFKKLLAKLGDVTGTERIHFVSAGYVRRVVKKGIDLDFASELIQKERAWARRKMEEADAAKSDRAFGYAMFTADYAELLYRRGEKDKALELYKEAMQYNQHRKDADLTNAYLAVATEFLSQKELKEELEKLVENGMTTAEIITRLKTIYVDRKGNEIGFDHYFAAFNKDKVKEKMESLRKTMLDETAPVFNLKDLNGNTVNLADLKGRTVILDFWATWCGPCKASFPAMQAMVNKYKNDPNVQFLFIDTYERGDAKEKNARDYITGQKFTFRVLMDNTDQVAKDYKAKNIPAKFVIDKNGKLRFRAAGFSSDADLMEEIEAMVELVK
ncbi:TlpA family protein disulfide reductase [Pedobacter africanus]|uniref:Thiol-disulfide isomerase or thioredoxin n=1 Tax=Pedobacter africanus TaxID=151894 RepID=A0A1W1Z8L6_9SPHI|nr:TlpA disulfide reductase family protein [Pedobacter africanus]SMC44288.1 Thiol-disulfide isomerase or thioredoxin [Pedobacter africanus]